MKRFLFLLLSILISVGIHAQDVDSKKSAFIKYYEEEQYEQAIAIGTELLNEMGEMSKDNEDYLNILSKLADCYFYNGETERAIELDTQTLELSKKLFGEEHPSYANSLNDLAVYYSDLGDHGKAIDLGTQAMEIRKRVLGEEHPLFIISLNNLASYFSDIEDYEKAIEYGTQIAEIQKKVQGEEHPDYATALFDLAGYYYDLGDYETALALYTQALSIRKKSLGEEHLDYANSLSNLASCYYEIGDYSKAIEPETKAMEIYKKALGEEHSDYVSSLSSLALYYKHLSDYEKAIDLGNQALLIRKKILGEEHADYVNSLNILAQAYKGDGDYSKAIELGIQALKIHKKISGEDSHYAILLNNLANSYEGSGDYLKALELGTEALQVRKRLLGEEHPDYAKSLACVSRCYLGLGEYAHALELGTQALEIQKRTLGSDHPEYAISLDNISACFAALGNYDEAIKLGTEALEMTKNVLGKEHRDYAVSMVNLAAYYANLGNYSEAIKLCAQATDILKNELGSEHIVYAESLSRLADYNDFIGNYDEAIRLGTESADILGKQLGNKHPDYASLLMCLASYYFHINYYHESIQLNKKALKIVKKNQGTDNLDYAMLLNNLANDYSGLGKYIKAIPLLKESLEIRKKLYGIDHPLYANALNNLACAYMDQGNIEEAIRLGTIALKIYEESNEKSFDDKFALFLTNLSYWHYIISNKGQAVSLIKEYLQLVRDNILSNFLGLTANERLMYWDKYNYHFSYYAPMVIIHSNLPDAASILYDNISLFAKGLLLTTELEISKLIEESGDTESLQLYSKLRRNREVLNEQFSMTIDEREIDCDSMEYVITSLERQLAFRVKEIGDYTKNLSITWQDVQSKLNKNDIAIEFLSYPENDSTTVYVALTLCQNDTAPVLTRLFTELEMEEASGEDGTYQTSTADSLIWEPLASRLEGKSHIYFSGSGMLHNVGIEYLPSMEGKECFRLSSTRELVTHLPAASLKSASLFGGIDYDTTYAAVMGSAPRYVKDYYAMNAVPGQKRGGFDYRTMRYGVQPLPYALTELKEISSMLTSNGISCDTLTGLLASEESFKALSGQRKSLLHIATHGFYYDIEEADNMSDHIRMMLIGDERPSNFEDQSLLRCGLCFAGANQILQDSLPPNGQDDGILNALEIAQTDLRGLDLVVLSACQTALGDIDYGEGVFGLQRGFKKAGAQSILMSLWEVDDEATHLLMTEFYKNWISGLSKYAALRQAQSVVKEKYPDPKYWAAFILLDALD